MEVVFYLPTDQIRCSLIREGHSPSQVQDFRETSGQNSRSDFVCTHCEITQTSKWRRGPLGKNTLCNACGIRYATNEKKYRRNSKKSMKERMNILNLLNS